LPKANDLAVPRRQESPALPIFSESQGPTFLSTTSTPSPPPSPPRLSDTGYPNPLRSNPVSPRNTVYPQNTLPLSPPSTATSPWGKQLFSSLTPLPLSPPILKPSTKPPMSLDAPNPTTRANFSPTATSADFSGSFADRNRSNSTVKPTVSHSASASMSVSGPSQPQLKHRSPSLSQIHAYLSSSSQAAGPPSIPLRISSIPADSKPRKLSLQHLRSTSNAKEISGEERKNIVSPAQGSMTPSRASPPLNTNKELPSPPTGENSQRRVVSDPDKKNGTLWQQGDHPGIAELPATTVRHSRLHSQPQLSSSEWGSYAQLYDRLQNSVPGHQRTNEADSQVRPSSKEAAHPKQQAKAKQPEDLQARKQETTLRSESTRKTRKPVGDEKASSGRPTHMSRTQKDKDRKKRSKAKILTEHVDLIKDDFWEKRPWILSGRTG
jgi:tRNA(His) guanylyltransferase